MNKTLYLYSNVSQNLIQNFVIAGYCILYWGHNMPGAAYICQTWWKLNKNISNQLQFLYEKKTFKKVFNYF